MPYDTHCWIVEDLSEGRHLHHMLYARFLKFVISVAKNKRVQVRALYEICKDDIRSIPGSNIRTISQQTEMDPRQLNVHLLKNWRVYKSGDNWTVPLLQNLIQVRGDGWEILFDDETSMTGQNEDVEFIIQAICTG